MIDCIWPKGARSFAEIPWPVRIMTREELLREYPSDSDTRPKDGDAKQGSTRE